MYKKIAKTYYPLLFSKLFIVSEIFICAVAVARFDNPKFNQAALSGLILPLGFLYESIIYDFVSASTALSKNANCLKVLSRYFFYLCSALTIFGVLVFVSPLVDYLISDVFNSSKEIADLAKPALPLLILWPWVVGYRRLLQGVMIRSGRSDLVGIFSCIRVIFLCFALYLTYLINIFPGAYSSTLALTISVCVEVVLVYFAFNRMQKQGQIVEVEAELLTIKQVHSFYLPLIFSSFVHHFSLSLASWAMFNMTNSILSLSVWGAISGIIWLLATFGHSYVDAVIYFAQQSVDRKVLRNFSLLIALVTSFIIFIILYLPPVHQIIFLKILKLNAEQLIVAENAMLFAILLPSIRCLISVPQGYLIANKKTKIVTQGAFLNVFILALFLVTATYAKIPVLGIYCYLISLTISLALQYKFFNERA